MVRRAVLFPSFLLLLSGLLFPEATEFKTTALKMESRILIDGILDEEIWQQAPSVSDFIQYEPHKGDPASLKTVVKILYDDRYMYFGFVCFDPEPQKIVVGTSRRDKISRGVDVVTVVLDTYHDKRSAYYFRTNLLGVQEDGRLSEDGRAVSMDWDGKWESAGARVEEGWSVEMAIPFESVKYNPGKERTWGIQFSRHIPRNIERSFWTGPLEDYRRISTYGELIGLELEKSDKKLELVPHAISRIQQDEKPHLEAGLDARYAFSQSISGNLTLNPDFATVEADQEQVNLTRFELNLPEKRIFFFEGSEVYQQDIRLFYSRRIADIYGGLKVYGKTGGNEIAVLSAQAKKNDEEGSANFSVVRYKRDILKSSTLGILSANKLVDGKNQGAFGLDSSIFFTETFKFNGQVAMSYQDQSQSDFALLFKPSYDTSTFHLHFGYTYLGDQFGDATNAVGFIRDDNRHELDSSVRKAFWLRKGVLDRIAYDSNYNIYWGVDKTLRSWEFFQSFTFDLRNRLSFEVRHGQEYKLYEKEFRNHGTLFELGYNTREWESMTLSYEFGRNFDSDFSLIRGRVRKNLTQDFSVEYNLTKLSVTPDPNRQSTWIHVIRATEFFTKDLFLKFFYQINTVIDKRNIQAVFVYRFKPPLGLIQLAYQRGTAEFGEAGTQGHTLFVKLAYVL